MSSRDPQSQTLAELRSWQAKAEKMVIVAKKDVKTRTELETDLKVNITRLSREADIATRQEKADWDACAHDIIHNPVGNLDEHATVSAKRFHRARLRLETIRHGNEKLLSEATFRKLEAAAQQARAEEEFSRARYEVGLKEISIAMAQASGVAGQVSFQSSPLSGILHHRARCPQCVVTDAYSSTLTTWTAG